MGRFYCEYCDIYLTHDNQGGRKQHCVGRKHLENVYTYYNQLGLASQKELAHIMYERMQQQRFPGLVDKANHYNASLPFGGEVVSSFSDWEYEEPQFVTSSMGAMAAPDFPPKGPRGDHPGEERLPFVSNEPGPRGIGPGMQSTPYSLVIIILLLRLVMTYTQKPHNIFGKCVILTRRMNTFSSTRKKLFLWVVICMMSTLFLMTLNV
mmetsp:Transcript_1351/g.1681  ORF Transcript_1351/g.1681 Transcript_1351/m.1681 type:complete len:208 (-) Transcript_1351:174-797(-)|eukprot:jgi/Bigna1/55174/estExt_Genewise1Plus.C_530004